MDGNSNNSDDGFLFIAGIVFIIVIVIIGIVIYYLNWRKKRQAVSGGPFGGGQYGPYENMTDSQLQASIQSASTDFYNWNESLLVPSVGGNDPGNLSSRIPINVPQLLTNMALALTLDPGMILEELKLIKTIAIRSGRLLEGRATTLCAKLTVRVGEKLLTRLGVKAAARALTAAATRFATALSARATVAASTGPAAPIVLIAEFTFQAVLGLLDQFGVGGYTELVPSSVYEGMRDEYDRAFKNLTISEGSEWPVIAGPADKLSQTDWQNKLSQGYDVIFNDTSHPATVLFIQLYEQKRRALGRALTEAECAELLQLQGLGKALEVAVMEWAAGQVGGKAVRLPSGNVYCSYTSSAAVDASFHWPLSDEYENEIYSEWDETNQTAYCRQSAMRTLSEQLGHGCTYNKQTRVPNITEEFCRSNGLDYSNGQCKYSEGQDIAEMIFGKTFTRGLIQVFDPKQYESCSDKPMCQGSDPCIDDGYTCRISRLAYMRTPHDLQCNSGYYESSPGFCKSNCPVDGNGQWQAYGGLCYHPKVDTNLLIKSQEEKNVGIGTPKVCDITQAGVCHATHPWYCSGGVREEIDSLCYNPCQPIGNSGITCPSGSTNQGGFCKDTSGNKVSTGWTHRAGMPYLCVRCPEGYTAEAATCRAVSRPLDPVVYSIFDKGSCPSGQEQEGALCYDPCPQNWSKVQGGLWCTPNDGFKVHVEAKNRKIPFSQPDFAGSPVGQRVQQIKDAGKAGDVAGVAAGLGTLWLSVNPVINGLGLQDFVNMIPDPKTGQGVQQQ